MIKKNITTAFFIFFSLVLNAQTTNSNYDSTLAHKLNADDYGMKKYVFVLLKTGSNTSAAKSFSDSCFASHLKNIDALAKEKKLVVAGPFFKNDKSWRGLFILNAESTDEAKKILETDPAIKNELLRAELFMWYGSAALPEYLDASDKIWKKQP